MVLFPVLLEWWQPDQFMVSWTVLGVAVGLAALGEVLSSCWVRRERGVWGRHTGRSPGAHRQYRWRDHGYSTAGAARVPMLGACLGAFVGALLGNLWAGRTLFQSFAVGRGAAIGQFWGTVLRGALGAIIAIMLTIDAFV